MHQGPLASLDQQDESVHQAQLVQLENPDPLDHQGRRVLLAYAETTEPLGNKGSEEQQDHRAVQETRATLGKTGPRVLTVPQAQLELQGREALWVFLVKEESEGCPACQDQGVHQENRDLQDKLERRDHQVQLAFPVLMGPVVILVLMALQDPTAHRAKTAFSDKGETEEIPVQKVWSVLTDFPDLQVLLERQVVQEGEETQAPEDQWAHRARLEREDWWDPKDLAEITVTWEIMEREDRRAIEASPACRVCPDLQVHQESREPRESWDQADRGDLLDLLGPLGRKDTQDSEARWDPLELVESVEKLDQRVLRESLDLLVLLVPLDLLSPLWKTSSAIRTTTPTTPVLLLLPSSARTRLSPTATRPPGCPWTPASWPP